MAVTYQQLCPVLFGTDAIAVMAKRAAEEGRKKAFICCDKGVKAAGAADKVADAFDNELMEEYDYDEEEERFIGATIFRP